MRQKGDVPDCKSVRSGFDSHRNLVASSWKYMLEWWNGRHGRFRFCSLWVQVPFSVEGNVKRGIGG
jgi:hypothetical protein